MPNTTTEKSRVHFLDTVEEDENIINTGDIIEEEEEQEEKIEQEEENEESENLEEESDESEEEQEEEEKIEDSEFSYSPFIQELVDSDLLVIPEGKEYDDTTDGFKELIDDNVHLKHEEFKSKLINPTSAKFIEFLEAGGNPDEYIQKAAEIPDYANMDLEDESTLKNLIADHLTIQGYDPEDIDAQIAEYEEIGSLAKHATTAQKYLIKYGEKELANITKQQQEAEAERIKMLQQEEETARDIIFNKEIGGFKLPKTERDRLYDYIFKPIKKENGKILTQNLLEDDAETKIALAYYKMKKFSFKDIEAKVETKQASKLQEQLRKKNDKLTGKTNAIAEERNDNKLQGWDFLSRR
jgi:hypothetical protein